MGNLSRLGVLLAVVSIVGCDSRSATGGDRDATPAATRTVAEVVWPDPADTVELSAEQWEQRLTPTQFYILRQAGTERPWTHPYNDNKDAGVYACAGCGNRLFESDTKFDSRTGWPSFYQPVSPAHVIEEVEDDAWRRTEVRCARCDGHLGHVFPDGYGQPTGLRYCMNGAAMLFHPEGGPEPAGAD